jgi:hypothetical protein
MDQRAVHLLVEVEVERIERAVDITKAGLLEPTGDEPVLPADELIADQSRDEIEGGLFLRLRLPQARLEPIGHAREPQLAERVIEFDEIHDGSPVVRSMRSR